MIVIVCCYQDNNSIQFVTNKLQLLRHVVVLMLIRNSKTWI